MLSINMIEFGISQSQRPDNFVKDEILDFE